MKRSYVIAAVFALAFAGAGCGRQPVAPVAAPQAKPVVQVPADTTGSEAATDTLVKDAAAEGSLVSDEANDAQEISSDQDQLNAITESFYGLCASQQTAAPAAKNSAALAARQKKLQTRRNELAAFTQSHRVDRTKALAKSRSLIKTHRDAVIGDMMKKAVTPEQRAAVKTFNAAVATAAADRETAVDAAIMAFRTGVDEARTARQAKVDAAIAAFAEAVKAAEAEAKTGCMVKQASIESARQAMQQAIKEADKVGEDAAALAQVRQQTFAQALSDYKAALDQAKIIFKASISHN